MARPSSSSLSKGRAKRAPSSKGARALSKADKKALTPQVEEAVAPEWMKEAAARAQEAEQARLMADIVARAEVMADGKAKRQAAKKAERASKSEKKKVAPYITGGKYGTEHTAAIDPHTKAPLPPPGFDPAPPPGHREIKMGRPSSYDPAMCEEMIAYGKQGYAVVEMAVAIGITKTTLFRWLGEEGKEEFREAFLLAKDHAEAFHARTYREGIRNPSSVFNAMGYAKYMGTVFTDWRDVSRTEITGKDGGAIEIKTLPAKELAKRMAFLLNKGAAEADAETVH